VSDNADVWGTMGCHPKNAHEFDVERDLPVVKRCLEHSKMVAVGEVGLDYSGGYVSLLALAFLGR
jgi:Tat protein secretion system quality control protein TatD with DNase activity